MTKSQGPNEAVNVRNHCHIFTHGNRGSEEPGVGWYISRHTFTRARMKIAANAFVSSALVDLDGERTHVA